MKTKWVSCLSVYSTRNFKHENFQAFAWFQAFLLARFTLSYLLSANQPVLGIFYTFSGLFPAFNENSFSRLQFVSQLK